MKNLSNFEELNKLSKNQKMGIVMILGGCFVVGLIVSASFQQLAQRNYQSSLKTTAPTPVPVPASLSFYTANKTANVGDKFETTLELNSPSQGIEAAEFSVKFDPDFVKVASASTSKYFQIYSPLDYKEDSLNFSGVANFTDNKFIIPQGKGTLATIQFEALKATAGTKISIDKGKTTVASGGKNILDKVTDLEISIK